MKYQLPVSNRTPFFIQEFVEKEFEKRGIDAVYSRYILSLLQQDNVDLEPSECQYTSSNHGKICKKHGGAVYVLQYAKSKHHKKNPKEKKKLLRSCTACCDSGFVVDVKERNKKAAVECLMSACTGLSLEDSEYLIESVMQKLEINDTVGTTAVDKVVDIPPSSPKDEAEKYSAAFPPLSGIEQPYEENFRPKKSIFSEIWSKVLRNEKKKQTKRSAEKDSRLYPNDENCEKENTGVNVKSVSNRMCKFIEKYETLEMRIETFRENSLSTIPLKDTRKPLSVKHISSIGNSSLFQNSKLRNEARVSSSNHFYSSLTEDVQQSNLGEGNSTHIFYVNEQCQSNEGCTDVDNKRNLQSEKFPCNAEFLEQSALENFMEDCIDCSVNKTYRKDSCLNNSNSEELFNFHVYKYEVSDCENKYVSDPVCGIRQVNCMFLGLKENCCEFTENVSVFPVSIDEVIHYIAWTLHSIIRELISSREFVEYCHNFLSSKGENSNNSMHTHVDLACNVHSSECPQRSVESDCMPGKSETSETSHSSLVKDCEVSSATIKDSFNLIPGDSSYAEIPPSAAMSSLQRTIILEKTVECSTSNIGLSDINLNRDCVLDLIPSKDASEGEGSFTASSVINNEPSELVIKMAGNENTDVCSLDDEGNLPVTESQDLSDSTHAAVAEEAGLTTHTISSHAEDRSRRSVISNMVHACEDNSTLCDKIEPESGEQHIEANDPQSKYRDASTNTESMCLACLTKFAFMCNHLQNSVQDGKDESQVICSASRMALNFCKSPGWELKQKTVLNDEISQNPWHTIGLKSLIKQTDGSSYQSSGLPHVDALRQELKEEESQLFTDITSFQEEKSYENFEHTEIGDQGFSCSVSYSSSEFETFGSFSSYDQSANDLMAECNDMHFAEQNYEEEPYREVRSSLGAVFGENQSLGSAPALHWSTIYDTPFTSTDDVSEFSVNNYLPLSQYAQSSCFNAWGDASSAYYYTSVEDPSATYQPYALDENNSVEITVGNHSDDCGISCDVNLNFEEMNGSQQSFPRATGNSFNHFAPLTKLCAFFIDGACHKENCRYSHDPSKITCRFWEKGSCFKEDTCPFRHSHPKKPVTASNVKNDYNLLSEADFPSLSTTKETKPLSSSKPAKKAHQEVKKDRWGLDEGNFNNDENAA